MDPKISRDEWRRRSRRAFLTAGAAGVAGALGLTWLYTQGQEGGQPWLLRRVLEGNGRLWRGAFSPHRLGETPPPPPVGTPSRQNGDIGIEDEVDVGDWRLTVGTPAAGTAAGAGSDPGAGARDAGGRVLSLDQIRRMPQTQTSCVFKCIEGWSEVIGYGGVRFSDFLAATGAGTRDGRPWAPDMPERNLFRYAGLETPDGEYFVSLDMESMLHPKTVLATEINGVPLTSEHGAPLRLIVPVKYGIKNLKRVGRIFFADTRPRDYWESEGYDWYAGL